MGDEETNKVCTFTFKKAKRKQQQRGRQKSASDSSASSEEESAVIRREKTIKFSNPLKQQTSLKALKKRKASSSSEDESSNDSMSEVVTAYKSKRTAMPEGPTDMGATATVEIDSHEGTDAQAVFERSQELHKELKGKEDDKIYRGMAGYQQFIEKRDTAQGNASSGHVRKGPMRAPAHLRATVRWDYQPDVCKDYKETGFCGFGDSCKFMHDRGDYKHGWQLEREEAQGGDEEDFDKYAISSDEDEMPFKCTICRDTFKQPIVTKCRHYFCEDCALKHYKKSKRCFNCGLQTNGIFNPAKEIVAKMKASAESTNKLDLGVENLEDEENND